MPDPAGGISLAQQYLKATLADVTAFRTWCGAADQAAALARIHHEGLPRPENGHTHTRAELEDYRPYAVIYTAEQQGYTRQFVAADDSFDFDASGRLICVLYQNCGEINGDDPSADSNLTFRNSVGLIIDGLCDLAGQAGYLGFWRIVLDEPVCWPAKELIPATGLWQRAAFSVDWQGI